MKGIKAFKVVSFGRKSCIIESDDLYTLTYRKDTTVNAVPGSVGIMCFDDMHNAEVFLSANYGRNNGWSILKVLGYGKRQFKWIAWALNFNTLRSFYEHKTRYNSRHMPPGTVLFNRVEVLT